MTASPLPLLSVAIDTASDVAGVALSEGDSLLGEITWRARQSHSRELLPSLDWLLTRARRSKDDIGAVIVCLGPGSYAGLRVGVSTAKALAYALEVPIVGVGRLAADAVFAAVVVEGPVFAVHAAGRAELAWAAYASDGDELLELAAPRLGSAEQLLAAVAKGAAVCGELEKLEDGLKASLAAKGARLVSPPASRVIAIARLGWTRLLRGEVDNADTLVPLYLRAPAIGPQPPR